MRVWGKKKPKQFLKFTCMEIKGDAPFASHLDLLLLHSEQIKYRQLIAQ